MNVEEKAIISLIRKSSTGVLTVNHIARKLMLELPRVKRHVIELCKRGALGYDDYGYYIKEGW